jgi:hypothetical protein
MLVATPITFSHISPTTQQDNDKGEWRLMTVSSPSRFLARSLHQLVSLWQQLFA